MKVLRLKTLPMTANQFKKQTTKKHVFFKSRNPIQNGFLVIFHDTFIICKYYLSFRELSGHECCIFQTNTYLTLGC